MSQRKTPTPPKPARYQGCAVLRDISRAVDEAMREGQQHRGKE